MLNKERPIQEIKLSTLFEGNISTRAAVSILASQINPHAEKVILNFSNIDFISRSFSHELLRFIENSESIIEFKDLNTTVKTMLKMVKTAKQKSLTSFDKTPMVKLSETSASF